MAAGRHRDIRRRQISGYRILHGRFHGNMRAIDLSGLETGAFRPVELSDAFPKIMLSPLAIFALGPDAVIYGQHYDALRQDLHAYFRPALYSDDILSDIVAVLPEQTGAQARLHRYLVSRSAEPISSQQGARALHGPQGDGTRNARVRVVGFGLDGRGRYLARHDDVRRQADA